MKMIGMSDPFNGDRFCRSRPLRPGRRNVQHKAARNQGLAGGSRNSSADAKCLGSQPSHRNSTIPAIHVHGDVVVNHEHDWCASRHR